MSIEAMKLAYEVMNLVQLEVEWQFKSPVRAQVTKAQAALRTAIEQAQPVAYDKTEMNCFAQDLYDKKMREGKRGHYESMFHVIHQCIKKANLKGNT